MAKTPKKCGNCGHTAVHDPVVGCLHKGEQTGKEQIRFCQCLRKTPHKNRWFMEWASSPSLCHFDGTITTHLWIGRNEIIRRTWWNRVAKVLNTAGTKLPKARP